MSEVNKEALATEIGKLKSHVNTLVEKSNQEVMESVKGRVEAETKAAIQASLDKLTELEQKMKGDMDKLDAQIQSGMEARQKASKSFGDMLADEFGKEEVRTKWNESHNLAFNFPLTGKAVGTMTEAASLTGEVIAPTRREAIVELAQRQAHVRELLPQGTMTSNEFRFVQENAGEGAANVTAEGATKNQIDFDLEAISAPVRKITGFARISEELLDDVSAMQAFLGRRLQKDIRTKEDQQLLYGTGLSNQLTGLTEDAASFTAYRADSNATIVDLVIQVIAQLEVANYMANGILLNPRDFFSIYLAKDSDGGYVIQQLVTRENGQLFIAGIPVFRNTAVAVGEYVIGDWTNGAQIFDRTGLNVRFFDQDQDNAIKNLVTVVAEERLAFPIFYADSFVYGTIATDIAKIKNFS